MARRAITFGIPIAVWLAALVRMVPFDLVYEEPYEFWDRVPTMSAPAYVLEPWAGYLQVWARLAFLVAHLFGEAGPLVTRLLAAGVIAVLAAAIVRSEAIPNLAIRALTALSLPFLPIAYPGPYIGPLNSQWWIAAIVVLIALEPPRRWHGPALLVGGLTGLAPILALPAFRDRRAISLGGALIIQGIVLLGSSRRPVALAMSAEFLVVAITLVLVMAAAMSLPIRTRMAFTFLGLAILTLGSIAVGGVDRSGRYEAVAWIGICLGSSAIVVRLLDIVTRQDRGP